MTTNSQDLPYVVLVDDIEANLLMVQDALNESFHVISYLSPQAFLDDSSIESKNISACIFDIQMPGINGMMLCEKIRGMEKFERVPVVFLSVDDDHETMIKGYEVGGDDYLTKPVNFDQLKIKIQQWVNRYQRDVAESSERKNALDMAMTAMVNGGEMAELNRLNEMLHECKSLKCIADKSVKFLGVLGLDAVVCIKSPNTHDVIPVEYSFNTNLPNRFEEALFFSVEDQHRIVEAGRRSIFNMDWVSVVVRNMPILNEEKYGRYKDHICLALNSVNSKCLTWYEHHLRVLEQKEWMITLEEELHQIREQGRYQDAKLNNKIDELFNNLSGILDEVGFTEDQEQRIMSVFDTFKTQVQSVFAGKGRMDSGFVETLRRIEGNRQGLH